LEQSKACSTCGQIKPFSDFPKHSRMANGINSRCKICHKQKSAEWRTNNRDKHLLVSRQYHNKNKERRNLGRKRHYEANKEYYLEYRKLYYLKTAEKQRQQSKDWRKNNPEKFMVQQRRRRAKELSVPSERYSWQDVIALHGDKCWICGEKIDLLANRKSGDIGWEKGLQLDHVIPIVINGPDLLWNVQPTHGLCNMRRRKSYSFPRRNG